MKNKETSLIDRSLFERVPIPKAVASLAIPTIISQLISMVYSTADTWFLGQTGDGKQVAAITIAYPVFMMMTAIANLFGIGGGSHISRLLGKDDEGSVRAVSAFSFWGALLFTLVLSLGVAVFSDPLIALLSKDTGSSAFVKSYLLWTVVIGGVPTMLNLLLAHLIRAIGEAKKASLGISLGGLVNLVLDPLFIFGFGMNVMGAAVATCLANVLAMAYFLVQLRRLTRKTPLSLSLQDVRLKKEIVQPVLSIGLPAALSLFMSILSNSVLNRLMSSYNAEAIAAVGIVKKADMIPTHITSGLSSGILPLLAYNTTSGNRKRLHHTLRFSFAITLSFTLASTLLYESLAPQIMSLFINDSQTIAYGTSFMRIHCIAMPLMAATSLFTVFFQAAGMSRQATAMSFLRKGITDVPLMIALNTLFPMFGILMAQPLMDVICLCVAGTLFAVYNRRQSRGKPDRVLTEGELQHET